MEIQTSIQYIFDANGNKTAVIIPISIWDSIMNTENTSRERMKKKNIESLFGVLKDSQTLDEVEEYTRNVREEAVNRL